MLPPVDYPVNDDTAQAVQVSDDLSYAALLDRYDSEELITESMIQSACLRIETAQQFPFASKPKLQAFTELTRHSAVANLAANENTEDQFSQESSHAPTTVKLSAAKDLNAFAHPAAKVLARWVRIDS